jgi:hypothetical protein
MFGRKRIGLTSNARAIRTSDAIDNPRLPVSQNDTVACVTPAKRAKSI